MLTAQKTQLLGANCKPQKEQTISDSNSYPAGIDQLPNLQVAFEHRYIPSSQFFLKFFIPISCANTCSRKFHVHFLKPPVFSVSNTDIRCSFVLLQQPQFTILWRIYSVKWGDVTAACPVQKLIPRTSCSALYGTNKICMWTFLY